MIRILTWSLLLFTLFIANCNDQKRNENDNITFQHVIVIVGDDHSSKTVGAYGNDYIKTPNLDRLAANGILFSKAYATSPICNASRQSMLTGKFPHATGVNQLFTPFPDEGNLTIAEHLRALGFSTAIVGKTHFNNWLWAPLYKDGLPDHGFDLTIERSHYRDHVSANPTQPLPPDIKTRENQQGSGIPWQKNADMLPVGHRSDESFSAYLVSRALEHITENDKRTFTWLAFQEPHAPFVYPIEFQELYHPDSVPFPTGSPEDDRWIPAIFKDLTEKQRRGIITSYYRSVSHMDNEVGRLLNGLEASGMIDETLIIYLGDQGYLLNDHKRFEKHSFWEESIGTPLIVSGKGLPKNIQYNEPVSLIDLAPTITDYLGVGPIEEFQGKSLRKEMEEGWVDEEKYVFAEYLLDNKAMVASKRWKYIFTTGSRDLTMSYGTGLGPSGMYHRLYDLENDPGEARNLAYETEYLNRVNDMQHVMMTYFENTHPEAKLCPESLNSLGQLVWYLEPRDLGGDYEERPARVYEGQQYLPSDLN